MGKPSRARHAGSLGQVSCQAVATVLKFAQAVGAANLPTVSFSHARWWYGLAWYGSCGGGGAVLVVAWWVAAVGGGGGWWWVVVGCGRWRR